MINSSLFSSLIVMWFEVRYITSFSFSSSEGFVIDIVYFFPFSPSRFVTTNSIWWTNPFNQGFETLVNVRLIAGKVQFSSTLVIFSSSLVKKDWLSPLTDTWIYHSTMALHNSLLSMDSFTTFSFPLFFIG